MRHAPLAAILALLPLAAAHADTLRTFVVDGHLDAYTGGTFTGTTTIDTTLGAITDIDFTLADTDGAFHLSLADLQYNPGYPTPATCAANPYFCYVTLEFRRSDIYAHLDFDVSATGGLVGFNGGGFCGISAECEQYQDGASDDDYAVLGTDATGYRDVDGSLVFLSETTTATPEPSTLLSSPPASPPPLPPFAAASSPETDAPPATSPTRRV